MYPHERKTQKKTKNTWINIYVHACIYIDLCRQTHKTHSSIGKLFKLIFLSYDSLCAKMFQVSPEVTMVFTLELARANVSQHGHSSEPHQTQHASLTVAVFLWQYLKFHIIICGGYLHASIVFGTSRTELLSLAVLSHCAVTIKTLSRLSIRFQWLWMQKRVQLPSLASTRRRPAAIIPCRGLKISSLVCHVAPAVSSIWLFFEGVKCLPHRAQRLDRHQSKCTQHLVS